MTPLSIDDAMHRFAEARREIVVCDLETLAILGEVQDVGDGRYAVAAGAY